MLDGQVFVIGAVEGDALGEGPAEAEVPVLGKHDQSAVLLRECFGHETRILIEVPDASFVASVEEDWSWLQFSMVVVILIINDVLHLESAHTWVLVVDQSVEEVRLGL